MRVVSTILGVVLVLAILIFAFQNMATVTVWFLNWNATLPVAVLTIIVYVLGMVTGGFVLTLLRRFLRKSDGYERH